MIKKSAMKFFSKSMGCLLFLSSPFCSVSKAMEPEQKEEKSSSVVKIVALGTCGLVLGGYITYRLFNGNSDSSETKPKLGYDAARTAFSNEEVGLLKKYVKIVNRSVVDEEFLNEIGNQGKTVVVNAANTYGVKGLGVCKAVFDAMGIDSVPEINDWKSKGNHEIGDGNVFIHHSYGIAKKCKNADYVMQTVGPDFRNYLDEKVAYEKLYNAYYNTVKVSAEKDIKNIVVPAISTGIFAVPGVGTRGSIIALSAIHDALSELPESKRQGMNVYLCEFKSSGETKKFFEGCSKVLK